MCHRVWNLGPKRRLFLGLKNWTPNRISDKRNQKYDFVSKHGGQDRVGTFGNFKVSSHRPSRNRGRQAQVGGVTKTERTWYCIWWWCYLETVHDTGDEGCIGTLSNFYKKNDFYIRRGPSLTNFIKQESSQVMLLLLNPSSFVVSFPSVSSNFFDLPFLIFLFSRGSP